MKLLTLSFFVAMAFSSVALAQSSPTGTQIGKMTVSTDILANTQVGTHSDGTPILYSEVKKRTVISEITVFVTSGGQVNYSINSSTIRMSGTGIDNTSTLEVYNDLALAAVMQGVKSGYTPCPSSVIVWAESCITRTGGGIDTRFTPSNSTSYSSRSLSASGTTSNPTVTQTSCVDPGCQGGIH